MDVVLLRHPIKLGKEMNIFSDGHLSDEARQLDSRMAQQDLEWAVERDEYFPVDTGVKTLTEIFANTAEAQADRLQIRQLGHIAANFEIAS